MIKVLQKDKIKHKHVILAIINYHEIEIRLYVYIILMSMAIFLCWAKFSEKDENFLVQLKNMNLKLKK
jgi:hypothetical protein